MYVGLFLGMSVRDQWRNQSSKVESVDFATSLWEAIHEKATCRAYDRKLKSHAKLSISWVSREKGQPVKYPQNILFGKKLCCFTKFFTHTIYTLITDEL